MAVKVELFLSQLSYLPGDIVTAFVKVINEFPSATGPESTVHISDLIVEAFGVERVDPSWISVLYQPDAPVYQRDSRKILRRTFATEQTRLAQRALLPAGAAPVYTIRFRLPQKLPPTFRGSSVRYSYHVQASVQYRVADSAAPNATPPNPRSAAAASSTAGEEKAQASAAFTVWPHPRLGVEEKRISRASSSALPPSALPDSDLPLLDYTVGAPISRIKWEPMGTAEAALLLDPRSKPAASSSPFNPRHSFTNATTTPRGPDADQLNNHFASDSDTESSILDTKGPPSPSSHTPRSPFIIRALPSSKSYNLRMGDTVLLKFTLQPPLEGPLQPGSTLGGVLDFRGGGRTDTGSYVTCLQVAMLLETEEVIAPECRPLARSPQAAVIRKLYCEQQEITGDTLLTHFLFTIPGSAPPSFRTPMVALQWVLRFEITTGVVTFGKEGEKHVAPSSETLLWSLPLVVNPPACTS